MKMEDMDCCQWTYGLMQDFTAESVWKFWWMTVGKDQNGNESGEGMVSGGNALLRRSGVCSGKDTGINQTRSKESVCC